MLINEFLQQLEAQAALRSVVTITELAPESAPTLPQVTRVALPAASVRTWQERALALAEARGLLGTGRGGETTLTETSDLDAVIVRVWSVSDPDTQHAVLYRAETDLAECDCPAGLHNRPCSHAGEAIRYGRSVRGMFTPEARAEAARMALLDRAHEQGTQALGYREADA